MRAEQRHVRASAADVGMASFCNVRAIEFASSRLGTAGTPPVARVLICGFSSDVTRAELLFMMPWLGRAMWLGRCV
jgi:hypothetical protein